MKTTTVNLILFHVWASSQESVSYLILESLALDYFVSHGMDKIEWAVKMQIECPVLEAGRIKIDDHLYLITEDAACNQKLMFRSEVLDYVCEHADTIQHLERIKLIAEVPNE